MKQVLLVSAALFAVASIAAPAAQASWVLTFAGPRCDSFLIEDIVDGRISGEWLFYDCANNLPLTGGLIAPGLVPNACPGGNGNAIIVCRATDICGQLVGGLDLFWVLDSLDGTLDENLGDPFGEHSCLTDELPYTMEHF